ncbi:hypothetical protein VCHA37P200_20393 [Vibrio chagasii]|nr:hypothetical protein VCHA37P200_20393 [Vibrio chagasii]
MTIFIVYNEPNFPLDFNCYSITYLQCKCEYEEKPSERLKYNHRLR